MNVWIQHHDFSSDELGDLSQNDALARYQDFDWDAEILKKEDANAEGKECCSPGMGFVSEDKRILHLVPTSTGAQVHYHYSQPAKFLGLFSTTKDATISVVDFPAEGISKLTSEHYKGSQNIVKELLLELGNEI